MTTKITPSLVSQINEVQKRLHEFVTQEHLISNISSWYVKYNCDIDCSEQLTENLWLNVTFDLPNTPSSSYGTYVSKDYTIEKALERLQKGYEETLAKSNQYAAKAAKQERERKILELIKEGKTEEAIELSKTSHPVS